jgi:hypothetical protein
MQNLCDSINRLNIQIIGIEEEMQTKGIGNI